MAEPVTRSLLQVEGLTRHFAVTEGLFFTKVVGQVQAVDGLDFTIGEGETFAIVGESGCGKTTTSKMLLRLEKPSSGRILLEGQDINQLQGKELARYHALVQAVFQDPWSSLDPRMRVRELVAEALLATHPVSAKEADERVAEVMNAVGLSPAMTSRYPHEFSGGQRQRIAIASALASRPRLIVLDEPVSALDVSVRAQVMNLLKDLQEQEGIAYFLIAHNLATVRHMAHQTAVMYLGQFVEHAETKELFRRRLHPYTQALFSASLSAHPDTVAEEIVLTGEVPSPINPPSGCRFHTRCPFAMPICSEKAPELKEVSPGYKVACHLH